jgi:hypothetical protein
LTQAANLTPVANLTVAANLPPVSLSLMANLQSWVQMFFFNSQTANPQTLWLNLQSQIRKFLFILIDLQICGFKF